ncbi:MAG: metal dependent phosphohydrolase [Acidimicrobiales bacterium]|nr:metal dependent phosphohydrolase [Acidimicrobiales bacterium]
MTLDISHDTSRDAIVGDATLTASRHSARLDVDAIASDNTIDELAARGHADLAAGDLRAAERDLLDLLEVATVAQREAEVLRLRATELEGLVRAHSTELEEHQLETFQRLAVMAEFRDTDTGEHTIRVGDLSAEIGRELGEDAAWCEDIRLAARLHDIGKVAVPDSILLKPGPLTPEEFEVMKTHTTIGAQILSGSSSPLIELGSIVALNHHERWDGTGYPSGRQGVDIPRCARIVAVADVFDALTSVRVYKHAWSHDDALAHVLAGRGAHFEPEIVDAFQRVIDRRLSASNAPVLRP